MKKAKLLLMTLLTVLGYSTAGAETVSPYTVDFNTAITTNIHDFQVASHWGHIVHSNNYDGYGPYYMSYSYGSDTGIDGTGALLAHRQYAGDYGGGETAYDLLVTPVISGQVKLYVKPSNLASDSQPSFIEFYTLNESATAKADLIQAFTANDFVADDAVEGWSTVTINVATPQCIGIRAQHVYMDNFSAEAADIVMEKKLTITSVTSPTGSTPYYINQKEDGSVDITLKVKLKNSGDIDLKAGDDNYTLTLVKKAYYSSTETVFDEVTFAIPEDLAVNEEKQFEASFTAPSTIETGWLYLKVKENISGSISSAMVQSQIQEYASKFIFDVAVTSYNNYSNPTTKPISFGKITETMTLNYEIYNSGSAPLTINSFTLPAGFTSDAPSGEFTVASGEKKQIAITLPADNPGIFSGDLTIEYTNFGKDKATYTLAITGTVLDPTKNIITFDDGAGNSAYPAGSVRYNVYISSEGSGDSKNYYLQGTNGNPLYITPLMTATAGENIAFDAEYSASGEKVEVMISTDRQNWTTIQTISNIASQYNWTTYTAQIPEAGNYYIGFKVTNARIDNIYGLVYAEPAEHNLLIVKSDIPTKGKQNNSYTATVSVGNIGPNVETAGSYTATLYVDGEAVATNNEVDLPVAVISGNYNNLEESNYTTLSFTFKPHTVGTLPAYIEVKSGDATVTTEIIDVTIDEEKVESEIAVGTANDNSRYVPFYGFDMENGAYTDFYFSPEQLAAYGIKKGDVITAISFHGNLEKTINTLDAEAWVTMEEAGSFVAGNVDKEQMTHVVIYENEKVEFTSPTVMTIDLTSNPITYDGVSEIRIYTAINGHSSYASFGWEVDSKYPDQAYYTKDESSWSSKTSCPVGYFSLAVEPMTFSGTVFDIDTYDPIKGATVTLYNKAEDVEYTGVCDDEGKYLINVIQNSLEYTITISAENYEDLKDPDTYTFNESIDINYGLMPKFVNVTISDAGFATLYYSNRGLTVPEGVTAYTVKVEGTQAVKSVEYNVIPQGSAVILEGAPGEYVFELNYDSDPIDNSNLLMGTDGKMMTVGPDGGSEGYKFYKLANGKSHGLGFYFAEENGAAFENEAHKAYLVVKANEGANFYTFNPTGISTVRVDIPENAQIYNLSGVRMNNTNLPAGIYIVNGKKVVIK